MSLAPVDNSLVGKTIAVDLYTENGILLLPQETILTSAHVQLLQKQRIREVEVRQVLSEGTGEHITSQLLELDADEETIAAYVQALDKTRSVFDQVSQSGASHLEKFSEIFSEVAEQSMKQLGLFRSLYVLEGADSYTYRHSLNVGILCSLIARLMKWSEDRIAFMGTAGFLHDLGKMRVPKEILLKPGKLTDEEFAEMQKHTVYGYQMIMEMEGGSELLAQCALMHHERLDGTGYPQKRIGNEIPVECQVLAVADMFDAICSDRVYKERTSPFEAAQLLWKEACGGKLNIEIVSQFVRYIALLYVGARARLSNGEEVEVILIHPDEPMRPLVRRSSEFLDLRYERQLTIEKMIG
ncbi:HD-GYP domain-containing protein [Brevibacillus choshinensis]|uniref:HD domain-containing protein n=1 Tax=Brevibacillus choshinensis TaxID=54911 RepID=A0ABX7FUU1_BRECH|nr:HD-GYP domain-containing protein [Brevibacillus choshinensis]QRG69473.1 HD domain-containing protein [Brevibacillus choshinensis]